jgi:hypothetical protein
VIVFDEVERVQDGAHSFTIYDCRAEDGENMVAVLADFVRGLYVDPEKLRDVLIAAMTDATGVADPDAINEAVQRTLTAGVPQPGTHPKPHLDTARNELGEALTHLAFVHAHGTVVPASRIRNKEIGGQPSRGRDLLGLDEEPLTAVIGEVKSSSHEASPPGVVETGNDCLKAQFLAFLGAPDAVLTELNWAMKHAEEKDKALIGRAMLAHIANELPLCAAPVLVRPMERRGANDFGTFKDNPAQFAPAAVRFSILTIEGSLEELADAVYTAARA